MKLHILTKIRNFIRGRIDDLRNKYGSSVAEHLKSNCDSVENFGVDLSSKLSKPHSLFHLKVLAQFIFCPVDRLCRLRECLLGLTIISI